MTAVNPANPMNPTPAELRSLDAFIAERVFDGPKFGLKKRGLWYRPDAKGYTDRQCEAWRLTEAEAKKHEYTRGGYEEQVRVMILDTPHYTTDPAASDALDTEIINKLGQQGYQSYVNNNGEYVMCTQGKGGLNPRFAEHPDKKICRALFAKQLWSK